MTPPPSDIAAEILKRPRAVIGTGTQGRRIALMLASQGGEVRIYARSAGGREEAKSFVAENLADIATRFGGTPGVRSRRARHDAGDLPGGRRVRGH